MFITLFWNLIINTYYLMTSWHAAYYLNPSCFYSKHFSNHEEVFRGLKKTLEAMTNNAQHQVTILNQVKMS